MTSLQSHLDSFDHFARLVAVVASVDHASARATLSSPSGEWALSSADAELIWSHLRPGRLVGFLEISPGVAGAARLMV